MSNELIHDVEESLKQERLHALWKEYGPYLIGGVVIAILLTALISGYRTWEQKTGEAKTEILVDAMSVENVTESVDNIRGELGPGQRTVADLSKAGIHLSTDDRQAALLDLQSLAADKSTPQPYRDFARLQAVRLQTGEAGSEALINELQPLLKDKDNIWHFHALYQAALIAGDTAQDYPQALDYLNQLFDERDDNVSEQLINQATALQAVYETRMAESATAAGAQSK